MRFAEEMMLNSTRYPFTAYMYRDPNNDSRCALGLVNGDGDYYDDMSWSAKYPWLTRVVVGPPCNCPLFESPVSILIAHLFNEHVMQGKNIRGLHPIRQTVETWSLEKLADWINLVDPTHPEVQVAEQHAEPVAEPGYDREECEEIAHRAV